MMHYLTRTALALVLLGTVVLLTGCPKKSPDMDDMADTLSPPPGEADRMVEYCDFKSGPDDAAVKVVAYYPGRHEDTLAAVKGLLKTFPKDLSVEIVDWRRPEGLARRDSGGLTCAGVTINGKNAFELDIDGKTSKVLFVRGIDGEWTEQDLRTAVKQVLATAK